MSLIAFLLTLGAVVVMCGVGSFFISRDRLLVFLTIKGLSALSLLVLAILSANLSSNIGNFSLFIILAAGVQVLSLILSALPTRGDMLAPLYLSLDIVTACLLCTGGFLLIPPSPFGLPIGFIVGVLVAITFFGITKPIEWKKVILPSIFFALTVAILGQAITIIIAIQSITAIMFLIASALFTTFATIRTFVDSDNSILAISKNIAFYLAIILFIIAIYVF